MNLSAEEDRRTCRWMLTAAALLMLSALTTGSASNLPGGARFVKKLHAPNVIDPREETLKLHCEYDLQGNQLYSVSWYKGDKMLFMYSPSKEDVHDKSVSLEHSNASQLTLRGYQDNIRANMELYQGTYVCEVTMELSFRADFAMANVSVAILPEKNPVLEGVQNNYQIGEYLEATCTSAPSLPAAELAFYLNNQKVSSRDRNQQPVGVAVISRLSTLIHLQRQHFPSGSMNLTCRASFPGIELDRVYRTTKFATLAASNQRLAQEPPRMSSTSGVSGRVLSSAILLLLSIASFV